MLVQDWLSGGFLSLEATDAIRACLARRGRSQAEKAPVPEERLTPPPERLTPRLTVETVFDFPLDLDTVKLLGYSRDPFTVALVTPRGHVENFTKPALHKRFAPFIVSRIERTIASLGRV